MHVLLATVGSSGDVHPFVGLGRALIARGHRATLITNGYFESLARGAGLEFIDSAPETNFRSLLDDPRLWHPLRGPGFIMRHAVAPMIRPICQIVRDEYVSGETVVVASTLAFGARVAQDRWDIPTATMHLSPSIFRSDYAQPRLPGAFLPDWLPTPLKRFQYWIADRLVIDRLLGPELNGLRRELGLHPVKRVLFEWAHSPQLVLAAFPDWFAPRQPDWPRQTVLTGFPLYDEADVVTPSPEVQRFVDSPEPFVAFTPGSANVHGREFFEAAIDACSRLGVRAMLLTRFPEQLPPRMPAHASHFDFVPFRWLLPHAEAVVHHGGIGSTSQGLAAGIPQLLMPLAFDQFDNAVRLRKMNVGDWLGSRHFTGPRVAAALRSLLDSAEVTQACREAAARSQEQHGFDMMVDALERLHADPSPASNLLRKESHA